MNNNEIFKLMLDKKFEEAILNYEILYKEENNISYLRKISIALLNLNKYNETIDLLLKIIEIEPLFTESDYIRLAISYYCIGENDKIFEILERANKTKYTLFNGMIPPALQLFFSTINNNFILKEKLIKKYSRKKLNPLSWPGLLSSILFDDSYEKHINDFFNIHKNQDTEIKLFYIDFFLTVRNLLDGNKQQFYLYLSKNIESKANVLNELFYLSAFELSKKI